MAIMRTNRLTSKTTTPPSKSKSFTPASQLEAQDAAYKKYKEQDLPLYEKRMQRYNEEIKSPPRDYTSLGGKKNVKYLEKAEVSAYNKMRLSSDPTAIEFGTVGVGKSYSKKAGDKDFMIATEHTTSNPIKPTAPTKANPADWSNVELNKMDTKKSVVKTKPGKLKELKSQEARPGFDAPGVETKTVSKTNWKICCRAFLACINSSSHTNCTYALRRGPQRKRRHEERHADSTKKHEFTL